VRELVDGGFEDVGLIELTLAGMLANSDRRMPLWACRFLNPLLALDMVPPQNSRGFPGHGIVQEPCSRVTAISDVKAFAQ